MNTTDHCGSGLARDEASETSKNHPVHLRTFPGLTIHNLQLSLPVVFFFREVVDAFIHD
jgi:hypothetical protein